ncbi:transmembrane protein [Legionella beliardensis]|uniref:Protoporphyrinogen IX oxidase n=1 Tax=Legionella beliardensis TaxID=91822 RepID=A0A378I1S2_9GAMM|nr:protoporphyrinogen oxidase HemJ [Legionella beliardensis]STX29119.1 transmembrane protein [Legionella beliardensis]
MLVVKAFHIIAMVAWFAGLFYLPRLFVYHAAAKDKISDDRFKIMERRLYYGITWPAALLTTGLGIWLLTFNPSYYLKAPWMHAKLTLVIIVWLYHLGCGYFLKCFARDSNCRAVLFFRIFNEIPTVLLTGIVLLVVVKPF